MGTRYLKKYRKVDTESSYASSDSDEYMSKVVNKLPKPNNNTIGSFFNGYNINNLAQLNETNDMTSMISNNLRMATLSDIQTEGNPMMMNQMMNNQMMPNQMIQNPMLNNLAYLNNTPQNIMQPQISPPSMPMNNLNMLAQL
jgi:hypothetical protein